MVKALPWLREEGDGYRWSSCRYRGIVVGIVCAPALKLEDDVQSVDDTLGDTLVNCRRGVMWNERNSPECNREPSTGC
jgi:hypothetical protein